MLLHLRYVLIFLKSEFTLSFWYQLSFICPGFIYSCSEDNSEGESPLQEQPTHIHGAIPEYCICPNICILEEYWGIAKTEIGLKENNGGTTKTPTVDVGWLLMLGQRALRVPCELSNELEHKWECVRGLGGRRQQGLAMADMRYPNQPETGASPPTMHPITYQRETAFDFVRLIREKYVHLISPEKDAPLVPFLSLFLPDKKWVALGAIQ